MIRHYECLDCHGSNNINFLELTNQKNSLFGRLICGNCQSFEICLIHPLSDKKLLINSDLLSIDKYPDMVAMTQEERKLEEIFLRSDNLTFKLIDIYLEKKGLIDSLEEIISQKNDDNILVLRMLKSNNQRLFNLIEEIKLINQLTQR